VVESAKAGKKTLIVPDKDADGLTSGVILYKSLVLLGLHPGLINVHLVQKGTDTSTENERQLMGAQNPEYIFILDQGSRKSPPVIQSPHKALVIDHHFAGLDDHPEGALFVNACNSPPVATSSLLTYTLCSSLHSNIASECDWLCVMGTHGDLGNTLKWEAPFPNMKETFKKYTKKSINDAVSLINAPRRTAAYDVVTAWDALLAAESPSDTLKNARLITARAEVNAEVERCTHTPPKFSYDSKIAVFHISSQAQVHPVIATRWAGHLQSSKLEIILVANYGYLPDKVNFSCRIPRCARTRDPPVNIIASLRSLAATSPDKTLLERLGDSFARGHKEASGGVVGQGVFEELMQCVRVGEKPEKIPGKKEKPSPSKQKNTLMNYFGKESSGKTSEL
jgi:hypothetical protein